MPLKIFISQVMKGKTNTEIAEEREDIKNQVREIYGGEAVEFLDSFMPGLKIPKGHRKEIYYMSKTLEVLAQADIVVFSKDWCLGNGTVIEHEIASRYKIPQITADRC